MSAAVRTSVSLNSMFKSRPNCLVFSINMAVAARRPGASEFDVIVTRRTVDTEKSLRSEVNGWPDRSDTALLVVHYPFVRAILTSSSARPSCRRACPAINCPNCGGRLVNILWAQPGCGFTLFIEALAMTLATSMLVADAARLVRVHGTLL